jgi:hypothetical protein
LTQAEILNVRARDIALRHFLGLLKWLRTVLVQDAAVLCVLYPSAAIFDHPPFNSTVFRDFARKSSTIITKAEKDVALALEKLPEHIANTFHAAMARLAIDQQIEREATKTFQEEMLALFQGSGGAGGTKKRRKVAQESRFYLIYSKNRR